MIFKEFRTQRNLTQAQAADLFGIYGRSPDNMIGGGAA